MDCLPLARYRLDFSVTAAFRTNFYSGSLLRGVFGRALRRLSCVTRQPRCEGCLLLRTCPYPAIFETPAPAELSLQTFREIPHPYVIEPPAMGGRVYAEGDDFSFHLVLLGDALKQAPLIFYAWQQALAQGVGMEKGQAELRQVTYCAPSGAQHAVYLPAANPAWEAHEPEAPQPLPPRDSLTLRFSTPLRIKRNGHLVGRELTPRDLLISLLKRYHLLRVCHTAENALPALGDLAERAGHVECEKDLRWRDWQRFSSRQQQLMNFGGLLGDITLTGELGPFLEVLGIGQWMHVGKNASFGLGHYQVLA